MIAGVVTLVSIGQLDVLTHQEFGLLHRTPIPNEDDDQEQPSSSSSSAATTPTSEEPRSLEGDSSSSSSGTSLSSQESQLLASINLPQQDKERLKRAAHILRQRLILRLWLDDHGLLEYAHKLEA